MIIIIIDQVCIQLLCKWLVVPHYTNQGTALSSPNITEDARLQDVRHQGVPPAEPGAAGRPRHAAGETELQGRGAGAGLRGVPASDYHQQQQQQQQPAAVPGADHAPQPPAEGGACAGHLGAQVLGAR